MMPEKPSPKAAATVNSPVSFCVDRKAATDAACQADPISTVASPPIRSEIAPQICRLRNAVPSSTDSIKAPADRLIPRSLQKATRWPCGIAMGMQHSTPAPHIIANTALGGQPRTRALLEPDSDAATGNLTVHRPVLPGIVCGTDSFTASY